MTENERPTPCPDPTTLERFQAADLPPPAAAEVDTHLAACPACAAHLDRITQGRLRLLSLDGLAPPRTPPHDAGPPPAPRGYELIEPLGAGGMGEVWRARQLSLGRTVAVKFLGPRWAGEDELRDRFRTEAEAVARLSHPNVVGVYEFDLSADRPFFSMELVDGPTLAAALAGGAWAADRAAALVERVARAVEYAHTRGVLHRDLKPANILLAADDTPKVADFGLAKRLDADPGRTQAGQRVGTPAYMSPEQAAGKPVGVGTDVYALGAVLYHLLAARPPFVGETSDEVLAQTLAVEPMPLRRLRPGLSRDLETVCLRCLHKEEGRRFPSAAELADDLRRVLAGEPVRSRPVGPTEQVVRWARRRWLPLTLTATVVVVAGIGGGLYWQQAEASRGVTREAVQSAEEQLAKAEGLEQAGRVAEALEVVRGTAAALAPHAVPGDLAGRLATAQARLGQEVRERRAVAAFDDIRLGQASEDYPAALTRYAAEFAEVGVHPGDGTLDEAADPVLHSGHRAELVRALEDWAWLAKNHREAGGPVWERLAAVAAAADADDPLAARFRHAVFAETEPLGPLADSPEVAQLSAQRVVILGESLASSSIKEERERAVPMLTAAVRRRLDEGRDDLWLRTAIAQALLGRAKAAGPVLGPADAREALRHAEVAVGLRPASGGVHNNVGTCLMLLDRWEEAEQSFTRARDMNPVGTNIHFNLGLTYLRLGRSAEAEAAIRAAVGRAAAATDVDREGRLRNTEFMLGVTLARLGRRTEAVEQLKASFRPVARGARPLEQVPLAQRKTTFAQVCLERGDVEEGGAIFVRLSTGIGGGSQETLRGAAHTLRLRGLRDSAAEAATAADKTRPGFAAKLYPLDDLRRQAKAAPADSTAQFALARAQLFHDEWEKAETTLNAVLETNKKSAEAHFLLGLVKADMLGTLAPDGPGTGALAAAALANFDAALNLDGGNADAAAHRALLLDVLASRPGLAAGARRKAVDEAVDGWDRAVKARPEASTRVMFADLLKRAGRADESLVVLKQIDKSDSRGAMALGLSYLDSGRIGEAERALRAAADDSKSRPWSHPWFLVLLSRSLLPQGRLSEARAFLEEALRLDPGDSEVRLDLAKGQYALGEFEAVSEGLKQLLPRPGTSAATAVKKLTTDSKEMLELKAKLAGYLDGTKEPEEPRVARRLGHLAHVSGHHSKAVRFFDRLDADDLTPDERARGARSALLTAAGQGTDTPADDGERTRLRAKAMGWLKTSVKADGVRLKGNDPTAVTAAKQALGGLRCDPTFKPVRDAAELAKLPEAERSAWQALWADVDKLLPPH